MEGDVFIEPRSRYACGPTELSNDAKTLCHQLREKGYAAKTIEGYERACTRFIEWAGRARKRPRYLDKAGIERFVTSHLPHCQCIPRCPSSGNVYAGLRHLEKVVIERLGKDEYSRFRFPPRVVDEILVFEKHLDKVCGLSPATQIYRIRYAGEFLQHTFGNGEISPSLITPLGVHDYICRRAQSCRSGTASVIGGSIKSYLKFLILHGKLEAHLLLAIPRVANWRLSGLPTVLSATQIQDLLASFNLSRYAERRDHAMALFMLDLGLRAGEVATLRLDDIHWRAATVRLCKTKSRKARDLPLSERCWNAIVYYVREGRPASIHRQLFLRHRVPVGVPMSTENVRGAMRKAYARAGFPEAWTGTHLLRHTAATRMQARGATLKEVADVLGHQSIDTTMIYTKLDEASLRSVALPWPEITS